MVSELRFDLDRPDLHHSDEVDGEEISTRSTLEKLEIQLQKQEALNTQFFNQIQSNSERLNSSIQEFQHSLQLIFQELKDLKQARIIKSAKELPTGNSHLILGSCNQNSSTGILGSAPLSAAAMPQGNYTELHRKRKGYRLDHFDWKRKEAREIHKRPAYAQKALGIKGKMFAKKCYAEKALMKKTLAMHDESSTRRKVDDKVEDGAIPAYLMDRDTTARANVLSNTTKQKREEKAGRWEVRPVAVYGMFCVVLVRNDKTFIDKTIFIFDPGGGAFGVGSVISRH